ncbi:MAG TPA: four helix bundle protein [Candidatus Bathyarchaeia archaeon]|nr:four helix bundle protein [Candidatus Bathyarchaeia archaeon]
MDKAVDLRQRTKSFALRVIRAYAAMPKNTTAQVIGKQMLRAATSVGAHYREAVRARSTAEFVSKIEGALQELDETLYWMELSVESSLMKANRMNPLMTEANELIAILTRCAKNAKRKCK